MNLVWKTRLTIDNFTQANIHQALIASFTFRYNGGGRNKEQSMSSLPKQRFTEEEYLAFERASSEKHELIDGEIVAMTGAIERHNRIVTNVSASFYNQIGERSYSVYSSDMRVRLSSRQYTYPDIVVVCGETVLADDDYIDVLLNPTIII